MKTKLPKGFISIKKRIPNTGRNIIIIDRHGNSYRAMRVDDTIYEDVNMIDHPASEIIGWKDGRK